MDTHIALWAITNDARLPAEAKTLLTAPRSDVFYSVASLWEIAIKASIGRLTFGPLTVADELRRSGFQRLAIEEVHLETLTSLPRYHRDPFDRLLVAQAEAEPLKLLTVDHQLKAYGSSVLVL